MLQKWKIKVIILTKNKRYSIIEFKSKYINKIRIMYTAQIIGYLLWPVMIIISFLLVMYGAEKLK